MKKIGIIGAGGINSWVIQHLRESIDLFDKQEVVFVKIFDNDEVEEKNLLRHNQNFKIEDLMQQKAEVLSKRYNFISSNIFITEDNINDELKAFDDIILGVDNHKTRRLVYKFCLENDKYLLDLRAQGTLFAFYILDHTKDLDYYDEKFFKNKNVMERKGSCQLDVDIQNDNIQNANKIIAYFGIYGIYLQHLRDQEISTNEFKFAY
jgi:molybdopterin/thiamine biosynthesis adenylyltransferase